MGCNFFANLANPNLLPIKPSRTELVEASIKEYKWKAEDFVVDPGSVGGSIPLETLGLGFKIKFG